MRSTKWTQIEKIQFQFTKHCDAKYSHAHQVLNIAYSNPLDNIEDLFLDDTRTTIYTGSAAMIKGGIITMVTSLATDTNDILRITKLLKKCPVYTTDKECDSRTIINDEIFNSIFNV